MTIWFTSDWHLGHENIIRFCKRPFNDAKEMDEALLTYHNELVKPYDHVYHLGDVSMERGSKVKQEEFIKQVDKFHGHKRLLLGNHDHFPIKCYAEVFEEIRGSGRWIENILFSHFPVHPSSMGGCIANVHGHIHDNPSPKPVTYVPYPEVWNPETPRTDSVYQPYVNICVEQTGYKPISLDELKVRIRTAEQKYREELESEVIKL